MNEMHQTTIKDRIKDAIAALRGKPHHCMTLGIEVKRCSECNRVKLEKFAQLIENEIDHSHKNYGAGEAEYRAGLWRAMELMEEARKQ